MHDRSIGFMAAQVKTSFGELPLIDRLSALTVAIINDEPDTMHSVSALVSVAALLAQRVGVSYLRARRASLNRDGTEKSWWGKFQGGKKPPTDSAA